MGWSNIIINPSMEILLYSIVSVPTVLEHKWLLLLRVFLTLSARLTRKTKHKWQLYINLTHLMLRLAIFIDWLHLLILFEMWILQLKPQFLYYNLTVIKNCHDKYRARPLFWVPRGPHQGRHVSNDLSTFEAHYREGASFFEP